MKIEGQPYHPNRQEMMERAERFTNLLESFCQQEGIDNSFEIRRILRLSEMNLRRKQWGMSHK